jgi:adenylate kinase
LKRRLEAYREQTAPLVDYYRWQGSLRTIDGMAPIDEVAQAIDQALAGPEAEKATGGAVKARKASESRANGRPAKVKAAKPKIGKPKIGKPKVGKSKTAAGKSARSKKTVARKGPAAAAGRRKAAARKSSKGKR